MIIDLEHAGQPGPVNYRLQSWPLGVGGEEIGSQPYTNACNVYLVGKLMADCSNVVLVRTSCKDFYQQLAQTSQQEMYSVIHGYNNVTKAFLSVHPFHVSLHVVAVRYIYVLVFSGFLAKV